ncbi:MAG: six-cysteine ranthipeptide SCIFF [Peptococcaceae bacterium]|nr:six-cysteine ranthipeptide SCIFF [Peptococcaceae bacterium]
MNKHITIIVKGNIKTTENHVPCRECQTSCQSACKTSCTVGNQNCQSKK